MTVTCDMIAFDGPDMDNVPRQYKCNREATTMAVTEASRNAPKCLTPMCPEHYLDIVENTPTGQLARTKFYMFFADVEMPYSEVMMHMRLAGTRQHVYVISERAAQIVQRSEELQYWDIDGDWVERSGPVTVGEAGVRQLVHDRIEARVVRGRV